MIVFKLTELSHICSKQIITPFNCLNKTAAGESLDLYWKSVFKKILFVESLVLWKKNEKRNEMKFWTFVWTCYTWGKCNMENATFFLIIFKCRSMQIQWLQNWCSKCNSKGIYIAAQNGRATAFICLQSSFSF